MTRQGVRWRFQRVFTDLYVQAFETILLIERVFGSALRDYAIRISKERFELRRQMESTGFQSADALLRAAKDKKAEPQSDRGEGPA